MSRRPTSVVQFAVSASSGQLVEPPAEIRNNGFATGTRPPAQWINYMFANIAQWVDRSRSASRSRWSRGTIALNLIACAVDSLSDDRYFANPVRRLVALEDTGLNQILTSVRGDSWTALPMEPSASIGAPLCVCATNDGWLVGGTLPAVTDGGIWSTLYAPNASSAITNPVNNWTIHTLPATTTEIRAIACRPTGTGAGDAVASTQTKIIFRSGPTAWSNASLATAVSGNVLDVCDVSTAWLAVTSNGQVYRVSTPSGTWSVVTTLPAAPWRLATNGTGLVVAWRYDASSSDDWYVSTDYGLSWSVLAPPFEISNARRVRFVDGTWFCGSSDFPYLSESNDLAQWNRIAVPIIDGANHRVDDIALIDEALVAVGQGHWLTSARGELVAQGPWSPGSQALPIADAGYLYGRAIDSTAPSNGNVLTWDSGLSKWKPGAGGGGSLPAGTNGGVLAYAAGAWASTGAGTERQILTSAGAIAPAWGVDVLPLTQRAIDGLGTSVTTCAVLAHDLSGGGGGAGIGARCELQARNAASTLVAAAAVDGVLTDATGGAEIGALDVSARSSGSLARVARFASTGLRLDWAARAITVLSFGGTDLDVWRVDGSSRWAFGSTDATNCGGLILYTPSTADVAVYRGATVHWQVDSSGATTIGTTSHATTLRGSALTIGLSTVVAVYQGGARVPETTISSSTTLDASHEVVFVDTTGGAVTLTLPAGASGRVLAMQRIAGANNVVIQRAGADTLRVGGTGGLTSWTINDEARHGLIYRSGGTEWVAEA